MGFVKSLEEILAKKRSSSDFYDAEMLTVFWETKTGGRRQASATTP